MNELYHHGIRGQKWGDQNGPPYPLSSSDHSAAEKAAMKKDTKWIKKRSTKIYEKEYKKNSKEINKMVDELMKEASSYLYNGKMSMTFVNNYNSRLTDILNTNVKEITSPSGRVVKFVAKRGELGAYVALADKNYDMSNVKRGVYSDGRQAYRKTHVNTV